MLLSCKTGGPLPPDDPHAISVYLPRWQDTMAWAQRDPGLLAQMKTGYPRFFIPLAVQELSARLLDRAKPLLSAADGNAHHGGEGMAGPSALLIASHLSAQACQSYLQRCGSVWSLVLLATLDGSIHDASGPPAPPDAGQHARYGELYLVTYPEHVAADAKAFWQHTGSGVSDRCAVYWLRHGQVASPRALGHGACVGFSNSEVETAAMTLRDRIARSVSGPSVPVATENVILHPTGMSAISQTASIIRNWQGRGKVAIFGFLYVDTYKTVSKIQDIDCVFYAQASREHLERLAADLRGGMQIDALYTEFPTNPLLQTPDLARLHELATEHDFLIVVDDTVGTSANLDLLPFCSIICTSLTKMFSGGCNVMGGSVVLNPQCAQYGALMEAFGRRPAEPYFPLDVVVMERNSRDVAERVRAASANAERVVDLLRPHRLVSEAFYPKGSASQDLYDGFRRPGGGYGFLLSIRFTSPAAAVAFHDALDVAKGPSLGTNFTLCCAYTLFAHFGELEWAAESGVVEHLVRISVGIEPRGELLRLVGVALAAAELAVEPAGGAKPALGT